MHIYQYTYTLLAASEVYNVVEDCYVNDIEWSHLSSRKWSTINFKLMKVYMAETSDLIHCATLPALLVTPLDVH